MKLKNKLLPFAGIAALGATFAPIALTSCGSNTSSSGSAIDLREWYTPTIEKHAYTSLTEDEAANLYFCGDETAEWGDWLDEDEMNERLTQDYLFGSSMYVQSNNNVSKNYSGNKVYRGINKLPVEERKNEYFKLFGIDNIVSAEVESVLAMESVDSREKTTYDAYNVVISDVRISHATNYYTYETGEEFPTISFELEYEIESTRSGNTLYTGDNIRLTTDDKEILIPGGLIDVGSTKTTQTHKGTLSVVNVPIMLDYEYCSEIGTYAWTVKFDYTTMSQTELSTRVPFAIYGTDNVTYTTNAEIDDRDSNINGSRLYEFDYYSNMLWEKWVDNDSIKTAANDAYTAAINAGKTPAEAKQVKDEILIKQGGAVKEMVDYINDAFFDLISYYMISVACK